MPPPKKSNLNITSYFANKKSVPGQNTVSTSAPVPPASMVKSHGLNSLNNQSIKFKTLTGSHKSIIKTADQPLIQSNFLNNPRGPRAPHAKGVSSSSDKISTSSYPRGPHSAHAKGVSSSPDKISTSSYPRGSALGNSEGPSLNQNTGLRSSQPNVSPSNNDVIASLNPLENTFLGHNPEVSKIIIDPVNRTVEYHYKSTLRRLDELSPDVKNDHAELITSVMKDIPYPSGANIPIENKFTKAKSITVTETLTPNLPAKNSDSIENMNQTPNSSSISGPGFVKRTFNAVDDLAKFSTNVEKLADTGKKIVDTGVAAKEFIETMDPSTSLVDTGLHILTGYLGGKTSKNATASENKDPAPDVLNKSSKEDNSDKTVSDVGNDDS